MDPCTMAILAAQQQNIMDPMSMGPMISHPGMSDPISTMYEGGMGGMGGDPRESIMGAMQGGRPSMPDRPGGGNPYGMTQGQSGVAGGSSGSMVDSRMTGSMAEGMGGVMNPRMAAGLGGEMGGGMGGMMDPRIGGGLAVGGRSYYGMMMHGQGGMAGGIGGFMGHCMAGGDSGFDMAMGIIMGGGSRGRRCRRC